MRTDRRVESQRRRLIALVAGAMAVALAGARVDAQSPLPAPDGEYAVGRRQLEGTDQSRVDPDNATRHRQIVVWVWYPASPPPGAQAADWMPAKWGEEYWSQFVRGHPPAAGMAAEHPVSAVRTHAYVDAPASSAHAPYPVLLFAPGLGTTPLEYASVIENVVSHGYVVAGIVPTYFAGASVFSDGRVVQWRDPMLMPGTGARPRSTDEAMRRMEAAADVESKDLTFALNLLAGINADVRSPLRGSFDLTHVGAFGHSLGGASALQFAHDDRRVRAVFDIDGSPIWKSANSPLAKPLLVLSAAATNVGYDAVLGGAEPAMHLRLSGTAHTFSSDLRVLPFLPENMRSSASTDPGRALAITSAYVTAFFDRYLGGKPRVILDGPSPGYPEITFERRSRP